MATQPVPLSKLGAHNYVFGTDAMMVRPELAALVAHVIVGWSIIEMHLGRVFGLLIGASKPATMSMYAAFRSFEIQRTLLQTAENDLLPVRYADILDVALTCLGRAARIRHEFAHGIWGSSQDIPDALLLAESKAFWAAGIEGIRYKRSKESFYGKIIGGKGRVSNDKIFVYQRSTLLHYCKLVEDHWVISDLLYDLIDSKATRRHHIYDRLCNLHGIRAGLVRRMKAQKRRYRLPAVS